MKTSQLDLDFARAQYGAEAVAGFDTGAGDVARRAVPRVHPAPAAGRRHPGGRADHPADARGDAAADRLPPTRGWTSRPRPSPGCGTWRTPLRRCSRRSRRGSPTLRGRIPQEEQRLAELRQRFAAVGAGVGHGQRHRGAGSPGRRRAGGQRGARRPGRRPVRGCGGRHPCGGGRRRADDHAARRRRPAGHGPRRGRPRAWPRCGRRPRRISPRRGALVAAGDRSGLRPQIARAEAALTSADALLRPADGSPAGPAGRAAAAGGGRHRAGAGAVGGPRRPDPDRAARRRRSTRRC